MLSIALYQPDIPQNTGAMIRLCACLDIGLHIIEPCGFPLNERKIRQSAMDYFDHVSLTRHESWASFRKSCEKKGRIILMTTKYDAPYTSFSFQDGDILLAGRESAGVPDSVHKVADARIGIPMKQNLRSLNIVNATAMITGEAIRQLQSPE